MSSGAKPQLPVTGSACAIDWNPGADAVRTASIARTAGQIRVRMLDQELGSRTTNVSFAESDPVAMNVPSRL